jgi:3-isopropylmalate dehydrogenase
VKKFKIILLPGDGIGPEVVSSAVHVLKAVEKMNAFSLDFTEFPCGAGEYLRNGDPLPQSTVDACRRADAVLLGAMGLPDVRWPDGTEMVPQIDLREILDLYAGIRPIYLFHESHCPLKGYETGQIDFVIFRENCEGLFASRKNSYPASASQVEDTLRITRRGAERIVRAAFQFAVHRRNFVTLVDKANVLPTMAYFRQIFDALHQAEFPIARTERVYVDAMSLYLLQMPRHYDVIVTENMFGDILSDLAAGLVGGMGMAPSADIGDKHAVFQPSHGTAPTIAGKGIANPIATILSAAMMLEYLKLPAEAKAIQAAVRQVMGDPANRTPDLGGAVGTEEITAKVIAALDASS